MTTDWAPIPGFEGRYEAHPSGVVRSLTRIVMTKAGFAQRFNGQVLKPHTIGTFGYVGFCLSGEPGGKRRNLYLHQLIALTFLGPRPEGWVVCHNDGDPKNNAVSNLRYDTRSGNLLDMHQHGTHPYASRPECKNGHEYTEENTILVPYYQGRLCRECARRGTREYQRRKRAAIREAAA